ncbi:MAG: FmdB family zinc ribbon protein [Jatrophihabitantaceae bacterium]
MPTYQYACTSDQCGLRFERVQAFTDPAVSECPDCSERVRKVYGSVGVVFKGSGFYRNESRDAKTGVSAKTDSDGASKNGDGAKDKGKSEAAKSDSGSGPAKSADSSSSGKGSGESSAKGKTESAKPAATVAS